MKICYLTHTLNPRTGMGVFSSHLLSGVKKLLPETELSVMTSEDYLKPNILHIARNWLRIRKIIKNADLVHALDGYPYGLLAGLATIGTGVPLIITAVGSGSIRQLYVGVCKKFLLKWSYQRANKIVAISHYVAQELKKKISNLSPIVINLGVDYEFWSKKSPTKIDQMLEKLQPYLLTQGEIKKRKGYSVFLPIFKEVIKEYPNLSYVVVANLRRNKEYFNELQDLLKNLKIQDKVVFLSDLSREELRNVYQKARAYVLLPQNINGDVEGFGLAILEAAAAGAPSIIGKGSGADDAVQNERSGFLVESDNQEEVQRIIGKIMDDDILRGKLSEGSKWFAKDMDWNNQVKKYVQIYKKFQS